jgi:hypothetical protein
MAQPTIHAYVNHGKWIVECQCRNAVEAVDAPTMRHHFKIGHGEYKCAPWGPEAHPDGFCGVTSTVVWPAPAKRREILGILRWRPLPSNQNWFPGETIAQLKAENVEHGFKVAR